MMQDFSHDYVLSSISEQVDHFEVIQFTYTPAKEENEALMSFRLTEFEKQDIIQSASNTNNMKAYEGLIRLLK